MLIFRLPPKIRHVLHTVLPMYSSIQSTFLCIISTQGVFQLSVRVTDDDIFFDDDVDTINYDMRLEVNTNFTEPQRAIGESNNGVMELSFRVTCDPGFIGENCATSKL